MRVELGAAARPANPGPQVRVEPSAPSAASASFAAAPPAAAARPAAPPLCALNHYRRWTGYVRPNRPVGDGALLDEFETVDDLRWAEGAPAYAGCRPAGHDGPCLDGTAGSQGSPIRAQREHFPPIRSS